MLKNLSLHLPTLHLRRLKWIILFASAFIFLGTFSVVLAQGGYIGNPGFETGSLLPWAKWGYPRSTVQPLQCCGHSGQWSAWVVPDGKYVELQQNISTTSVRPNHSYHLSSWTNTNGLTAHVAWWTDSASNPGSHDCGTTNAALYVQIQCDFTVPGDAHNFNAHLGANSPQGSGQWALSDDWSLTPILENAYRWHDDPNQGAYSAIVTGNPTLRDDPDGKWSYMRVFGQRIINGNVYYLEIGWIKGSQPESNGVPRVFWTWRDTNGFIDVGWGAYPGIGIGYNYEVKRTNTDTWSFYFNDLNTPVATHFLGWDTSDRFASGGETANAGQGMGDSTNNNVQYQSPGGPWYAACTVYAYISNPIYHVDNGSNCSSWRVYGNN